MALALRPVVSAPLGKFLLTPLRGADGGVNDVAGCCTVLSVFGVVILTGTSSHPSNYQTVRTNDSYTASRLDCIHSGKSSLDPLTSSRTLNLLLNHHTVRPRVLIPHRSNDRLHARPRGSVRGRESVLYQCDGVCGVYRVLWMSGGYPSSFFLCFRVIAVRVYG